MSYIFLKGEIENILVKVDMDEAKDVPLILGQSFLATRRTLIDIAMEELIMRVNNE